MIYSPQDVATIQEGGRRLATVLAEVSALVKPGVTTLELDEYAERRIRELGGVPSFKGYKSGFARTPYSSTLCTSINNEVVHAPPIPSRTLQNGDIIGLDIGMRYPAKDGFCTDMAVTVGVGKISPAAQKLISITRQALDEGIATAQPGARVRDISRAVQSCIEGAGFSIVDALVGHGVGKKVHEEPEVPNFVVRGPIGDYKLEPGLVIAIEPMVNKGEAEVDTLADGWTVATHDGSLSAHFEHTIAVTESGPVIMTQV